MTQTPKLTRYAWLSIGAAVATIGLKTIAYWLTGSVGLLSDALESLVNLVGGIMALAMLTIAARPSDEDHAYGHSKAEYFSSGVEGTLIMVAAGSIMVAAVQRLFAPRPLEQIGVGLLVSVGASLINLGVALALRRVGKRQGSITLQANASHLLTDVWTSGGVLLGVGAVGLTGWDWLDPVIALVVAANIVWAAISILRASVEGLMDTVLPSAEQEKIRAVLAAYLTDEVQIHALRTRAAGVRRFVSFHVLVPDSWTVARGHALLEKMEASVRAALPNTTVFTHLEPLNDPVSWEDISLDRPHPPADKS